MYAVVDHRDHREAAGKVAGKTAVYLGGQPAACRAREWRGEPVEQFVELADLFLQVQYVTAERIVSKVNPHTRRVRYLFVTACVAGAAERGYTVTQASARVRK